MIRGTGIRCAQYERAEVKFVHFHIPWAREISRGHFATVSNQPIIAGFVADEGCVLSRFLEETREFS